jgi:hypothetical protein
MRNKFSKSNQFGFAQFGLQLKNFSHMQTINEQLFEVLRSQNLGAGKPNNRPIRSLIAAHGNTHSEDPESDTSSEDETMSEGPSQLEVPSLVNPVCYLFNASNSADAEAKNRDAADAETLET